MRLSAAIQHIQHIASLGLAPRVAIPEMVDALQAVIPSSTNCFLWLDEQGHPCDFYERHPIAEAADAFLLQTPMLEATGQPSIAKLIRARGEFGNWWQFTAFDGWDRSVMKNELFRPYNIGNNMDFQLRDRGRPIGLLTVNREPNSIAFRRKEIEAMLGLRAHFVHAMNAPATSPDRAGQVADAQIATMLVEPNGRIIGMDANATMCLHQLKQSDVRIPLCVEVVPDKVLAVVERLDRVANGRTSLPATSDIATDWCTMRVTAHPMNTGAGVVITFQRLVPLVIRQLRNLARAPLSPGERRIALQFCSELTPDRIASEAGVTLASVREYSKRIRTKLGVNNREGVRALVSA